MWRIFENLVCEKSKQRICHSPASAENPPQTIHEGNCKTRATVSNLLEPSAGTQHGDWPFCFDRQEFLWQLQSNFSFSELKLQGRCFFGFLRQLFRTPTTKLSHTGLPAISFHKSPSSPKPQSNPRSSPALRASRNVTARFFLESSRIETRITCGKYREVSIMIINYMSLSAPI